MPAIRNALEERGGQGGVIAVDSSGEVKFAFDTEGTYRGFIKNDGMPTILIYREQEEKLS